MVSKGQIVGIDWNRIARLHSHALAHTYFECDWLIELSDNKLPDNNLISELVENRSFLN